MPGSRPGIGIVAWAGKDDAHRGKVGKPAGKCLSGWLAFGVAQLPVVAEEFDLSGNPWDVPVAG